MQKAKFKIKFCSLIDANFAFQKMTTFVTFELLGVNKESLNKPAIQRIYSQAQKTKMIICK